MLLQSEKYTINLLPNIGDLVYVNHYEKRKGRKNIPKKSIGLIISVRLDSALTIISGPFCNILFPSGRVGEYSANLLKVIRKLEQS